MVTGSRLPSDRAAQSPVSPAGMTRRQAAQLLVAASLSAVIPGSIGPAFAADAPATRLTAISLLGPPKMPPGFAHFDWVNPDAPKGGVVRYAVSDSFDSLNPFTVKGNSASGIQTLVYGQLLTTSLDEPATAYGLIAEWVSYPADYSKITFGLNPLARFHDGSPITVEDVIFSFEQLKRVDPQSSALYKTVARAEKTGERDVTFISDGPGNRDLPLALGALHVLSKAYWTGKTAAGLARDLNETTLELPLGSGPYRIKAVDAGRRVIFERVKDYWAKDLPTGRGQWNFDELVYEYYRDSTPAFEAFKAGEIDYRLENRAKAWAKEYQFNGITSGRVKKELVPVTKSPVMQGFALNLRRPVFQDIRVRRALNLAFDFEWANKNIFFDLYNRTTSYFVGTDMAATGALASGRELEILNEVRDGVPPEVFTTEWKLPENKTPEDTRRHLGEASRLLTEAGYQLDKGVRTNAKGERLAFEILLDTEDFQRIVLPYKTALERIGVMMTVRQVDPAQSQERERRRDFDMIIASLPQSFSPGNEQRDYWSSEAADVPGSGNKLGIKSAAIDKLVNHVIFAKDAKDLVAAARALDRVLLWSAFLVPQWHVTAERVAYWDMFGRPARLPTYDVGIERVWWVDRAKEQALGPNRAR